MENRRIPRPGELYQHFKGNLYQIITVAIHSESREPMVVYQALYGDFRTYVRPLDMFISEVDHVKYPEVSQHYRFELRKTVPDTLEMQDVKKELEGGIDQRGNKIAEPVVRKEVEVITEASPIELPKEGGLQEETDGSVNALLLKFLDAESYSKKLDILTSNRKHMDDRLINDMAVALDCTVNEGPIEQRFQELINCLQAMCRFEDRRLR